MYLSDERLESFSRTMDTPLYVYDGEHMRDRYCQLNDLVGDIFGISYAVKANPNLALLKIMLPHVETFDVSSYKEVERAITVGCPVGKITFSGPAKSKAEVERAVAVGIGELVVESLAEARVADRHAGHRGVRQRVLLRINPATGPKNFGVSFSGRPSQFGIDEEDLTESLAALAECNNLDLIGFHIYSGTNSLSADAIAENIASFIRVFRLAVDLSGIMPEKLIFGSGFGLPYTAADTPLDVELVAALVRPQISLLKQDARYRNVRCVLEMGRWLVGPAGLMVTSVVAEKLSRGVRICACDAGFNNHLAAFGMMGTVIRRNWRIRNITSTSTQTAKYMLVGPLCTSIDVMATDIELPITTYGDRLVVENSGAYGLTASPTRFISHPEPGEYLFLDGEFIDISESRANRWTGIGGDGAAPARATASTRAA